MGAAQMAGLTVRAAAERLGVTPEAVRLAIRRGRLAAVRAGGAWMVPEDALAAYQKGRRRNRIGMDPGLAALLGPAPQRPRGLPVGNWSPTRLMDWLICPARGAWATGVWELPPDWEPPARPEAAAGHAVHAYAAARLQGADAGAALLAAADAARGEAPMEAWEPLADAWERRVRPEIGRARAVEQRLEARIGGIAVTAVIDVVDEAGVIRDLKTAGRAPGAGVAWESLQAPVYTEAWRQATGECAAFRLDYLVGGRREARHIPVDVPVPPGAVDRIARQLAWAADLAARPHRIIPNPLNRFGCRGCPYRRPCAERFGFPLDEPTTEPAGAAAL